MTQLPHSPSSIGIFLGNNNKNDESIFLFDESMFLFLDQSIFFWEKSSYLFISLFFVPYRASNSPYIFDKTNS